MTAVWGSAYGMTHVALGTFDPATIVAGRLLIAAAVLGLVCSVTGARLPSLADRRAWLGLTMMAFAGTLAPFGLVSVAQQDVPSALAAIYVAAAPICVAALSHVLVAGEQLTARRLGGVLLGFCGVAALFLPSVLSSSDAGAVPLGPQLLLLGAALSYAVSGILIRRAGLSMNPIAMSFGFCLIAGLIATPVALAVGDPWPTVVTWQPLAAIAGLGVLATGVGALVYVESIRRVGPVFTSNVGNLAPFWSLLVGMGFLGEQLPPTAFAGLVLILAGIWLARKSPA